MPGKIVVVGLGPGPREQCPLDNLDLLFQATHAFRTHDVDDRFAWLSWPISLLPDPAPIDFVLAVPGHPLDHPTLLARFAGTRIELVPAPRITDAYHGLSGLIAVVDRLLGPGGCPWDQAQTHESLKGHLIEEAYEVLEAIDSGDRDTLKEELGDLLLQPVLHAQMAAREGIFSTEDVANAIVNKLIRRHPHVFGETEATSADEVLQNWDRIKQEERGDPTRSVLAGVPKTLPALLRAHEISKRAARVGFEWSDFEGVHAKLREEESEFLEARKSGDRSRMSEELGDLLFVIVNLARWCEIEPEDALRVMLDRFTRRFQAMEQASTRPLRDLTPAEWDALWEHAKSNA